MGVSVRLDGCDGRQGNYYQVESVLPPMARPVRQRFVNASILHLEKQSRVMRGDSYLFIIDGQEAAGRVIDIQEETGHVQSKYLEVESGEQYGPTERRPWAETSRIFDATLDQAVLRLFIEPNHCLRDVSCMELRDMGLLRSQDEDTPALEN